MSTRPNLTGSLVLVMTFMARGLSILAHSGRANGHNAPVPLRVLGKWRAAAQAGVALITAGVLSLGGLGLSAAQAAEPQFGTGSTEGGEVVTLTLSDPAPDDSFIDPFAEVSVYDGSSMALSKRGDLWAWGNNDNGQLGLHGTTNIIDGPKRLEVASDATALPKFKQVAAGLKRTLALDEQGNIWAWGWNATGALGVNGTVDVTTGPMMLTTGSGGASLPKFTRVSSFYHHSLAVDESGGLWAWGSNTNGSLGTDYPIDITDGPAQVTSGEGGVALPQFVDVAASVRHSLALDANGNIWGWGGVGFGVLGIGPRSANATDGPVQLTTDMDGENLPKFKQVASGGLHALALDESGSIWSWGESLYGKLGVVPSGDNDRPTKLTTGSGGTVYLPKFTSVEAAGTRSFAIDKTGNIWGWGLNNTPYGLVGTAFSTDRISDGPRQLTQGSGGTALPKFTQLSSKNNHSVAVDSDGFAWAWGLNTAGALGLGGPSVADGPKRLEGYFIPDAYVQEVLFGGESGEVLNAVPDLQGNVQVRTPAHDAGRVNVVVRVTHAGTPQPLLVYKKAFEYRGTFTSPPTPTVSGTARVGQTLTASAGTWPEGTTLAYQWLRNGTAISGATTSSYTLQAADLGEQIAVSVTGSRPYYDSATATSAASTVGPGALSAPRPLIKGKAKVGKKLSAVAGAWPEGTTLTYRWLRNGKPIAGAAAQRPSYKLKKADRKKRISVLVTGTRPGYATIGVISAKTAKVK